MTKCQVCRIQPAEWAKQYIGSEMPSYYTLGSHIRGFGVKKVCETCKDNEQAERDTEQAQS